MLKFANPEYLQLLYLLIIPIVGFYFYLRSKKNSLNKFAETHLHSSLMDNKSFHKETFKFVLVMISFSLMILSFASPQVGTKMEEVKQVGIDIYIALDVSLSMKAEDLKPNRLEQAKNEIASLMKKLEGDRIGLIIFAGQAYIQFPLTADYSAANLFLSAVDFNSIPQPGTAVAAAIDLAVTSFDKKSATKKVIIVITDGEDHEGDINQSVETAIEKEIKIYTIGMGSVTGAPIPIYENGRQIDYKKDNAGNIVLTKLDETTLKEIASKADGKYFNALGFQTELEQIFDELSQIEKTEYGSKRITDYEDKYYYFLLPAFLLLLLEIFVNDKKSIWLRKIFIQIRTER